MLEELKEFRDKLDNLMCSCMDKTIVIYGYGYSGRFVAWYADYYHSIKPRYLITEENSSIITYEYPLFRNSLFEFDCLSEPYFRESAPSEVSSRSVSIGGEK